VLQTACPEAAGWPPGSGSPSRLAGSMEVADAGVADHGRARGHRLSPDRLEIEITEAVLIHDDETALAILHQLRAIGVRIALDDFGTGFSSLSYLNGSVRQDQDRPLLRQRHRGRRLGGYRAGGGEHRRIPQHDHHGGRRRNRAAKSSLLKKLRLHPDAGAICSATQNRLPEVRRLLGAHRAKVLASADRARQPTERFISSLA